MTNRYGITNKKSKPSSTLAWALLGFTIAALTLYMARNSPNQLLYNKTLPHPAITR